MSPDLTALHLALQVINPNVPQTNDQRAESYRIRQEHLNQQAAIDRAVDREADRAVQARLSAPTHGVNAPSHETGTNVPR